MPTRARTVLGSLRARARARARARVPQPRERRPEAAATTAAASRRRPWSRPRSWSWHWRLTPVLALLTLATRLPSLTRPLWNPDEGFLATQARQLASGGRLYETVVDRKPPLVPWLYQGAFALFGDGSLWPLRVAAMAAVLVGAVLAASLARRRWGARAGWIAGVLYVLVSVGLDPEDAQAATFEVFMLPWTLAAMWCADRGRWACAGLCVAGAALTKQTGGAVLVPVLVTLWLSRAGWWALARTLAGAALPGAAAALAFGPGRFTYWMATGSGSYLSAGGAGAWGHALVRAMANGGLLALACAPFLAVPLRQTATDRARRPTGQRADLRVWLAASALATAVGLQFYGHYFLQLLPPLTLLGAAAVSVLDRRPATAVLALTALLTAGFLGYAALAPRAELDHARRLSAQVRDRTSPTDRVLLWGMHPEDYWLARRAPASRYLTAGFLTNYSGGRGTAAQVGERYAMPGAWAHLRAELRRHPPALVVDDSRGKPYAIARTPTLRRFLAAHYERAGTVGGAVLYARVRPGRRPVPGGRG
jgi:hypothetical protein